MKRLMPLFARNQYFSGMVQPVIDYGCVIRDSCGQVLHMSVHQMMKQYPRIILNVKDRRHVSTVTLFVILGWLPIDVRIRYFTAIVMYVIIHWLAPTYLPYIFIQNNSVHDYHTKKIENTTSL